MTSYTHPLAQIFRAAGRANYHDALVDCVEDYIDDQYDQQNDAIHWTYFALPNEPMPTHLTVHLYAAADEQNRDEDDADTHLEANPVNQSDESDLKHLGTEIIELGAWIAETEAEINDHPPHGPKPDMKYPSTPYSPWSPSLPADATTASMEPFLNVPIIITEKLDGSNVLIHRGNTYPRSVTSTRGHPWLGMVQKHHAWRSTQMPHLYIYGEDLYAVHAIDYDPIAENRTFHIFAVRDGDTWLAWPQVVDTARRLQLQTVPVLFSDTVATAEDLRSLVNDLMNQPSTLGPDREGVVIRTAAAFPNHLFQHSVAKMVRPSHVQPDAQHWSRHWIPARLLPNDPSQDAGPTIN